MKKMFSTILLVLIFIGCNNPDDDHLTAAPDISLNKTVLVLEKGKTERLVASFDPVNTPNMGHVWSSSAPNIAMVDETGLVTAIELGELIITVTALDGKKTASCKTTVVDEIVNVSGVSINHTEETIAVGDDFVLEAIVKPDNATDKSIKWSSNNNEVASVDENGKVTAFMAGDAIITAMSNDGGKTASCKIKVANKGVEISKPEVASITSVSAHVVGKVKPLGVTIKEVGVCYSTSQSPTVDDEKIVLSGEEVSGVLKNLLPETTYYVRIYAIVDDTPKYGDQTSFKTSASVDLSVPKISFITTYSAYVEGLITTYGLQTQEAGICYSTKQMPTVDDNKVVLSGSSVAYTLLDLSPETTYYVRLYAKVNDVILYGELGVFTTLGILRTHFEATDIYVNQLKLISPITGGVSEIDVCYGTSPNPQITNHIAVAKKENDGKLHLYLTNLISGTNYYIRSYIRKGSKVEYLDDEVSVQTMGKDFSIKYEYKNSELYDEEYYPGYFFKRFRVFLDFTYDIKPVGTYLVETNHFGYLKKTGGYSKSIYMENGSGRFNYKREGGNEAYSGASSYIDFTWDSEIKFTNIESNLCYHFVIPSTFNKKPY